MEAQQVIHHQASQTQEGPSGRGSPADGVSVEGTNPGYLCDEAFCTIEHSPLDRFDFIVKEPANRQQQNWELGCQRGALKTEGLRLNLQQPGTETSSEIQIQSHVSKMEANGASAVQPPSLEVGDTGTAEFRSMHNVKAYRLVWRDTELQV